MQYVGHILKTVIFFRFRWKVMQNYVTRLGIRRGMRDSDMFNQFYALNEYLKINKVFQC